MKIRFTLIISFLLILTVNFLFSQSQFNPQLSDSNFIKFRDNFKKQQEEMKIKPIQEDIEDINRKLETLTEFIDRLKGLEKAAKALYDPIDSPFGKLNGISDEPDSFTAIAEKNADVTDHKIKVLEIAEGDRLISDYVEIGNQLAPCKFTILSKDKKLVVNFKGGSLKDLETTIRNIPNNDVVKVFATNVDGKNYVLTVEAKNTGEEYNLRFEQEGCNLLQTIGLIHPKGYIPEMPTPTNLIGKANLPKEDKGRVEKLDSNTYILKPKSSTNIPIFDLPASIDNLVLEVEVKKEEIKDLKPVVSKDDFQIGRKDKVEVGEFIIESDYLIPSLGEEKTKENEALNFVAVKDKKETILINYKLGTDVNDKWSSYTYPIGRDTKSNKNIKKIDLMNNYSNSILYIRNIKLYIKPTDDDVANHKNKDYPQGKNYLTKSKDARLTVNGIEITRSTNNIKDAIPGVTINLHKPSEKESQLKIDRDYDSIVEAILFFKDNYYVVMKFIYHTTMYVKKKTTEEKENEKELWNLKTNEEKQMERLVGKVYEGLLGGDSTLHFIKTRLRSAMVSPYKTSKGDELTFIFQIGFKNPTYRDGEGSAETSGEAFKAGYLDVDKEKLKQALIENFDAVKELFSNDTDGDLKKDTGIAYTVYTYTRDFRSRTVRLKNGSSGLSIIAVKTAALKRQLKSENKKLDRAKEKVKQAVKKLERDFMKIKSNQRYLERQMKSFNYNSGGK